MNTSNHYRFCNPKSIRPRLSFEASKKKENQFRVPKTSEIKPFGDSFLGRIPREAERNEKPDIE